MKKLVNPAFFYPRKNNVITRFTKVIRKKKTNALSELLSPQTIGNNFIGATILSSYLEKRVYRFAVALNLLISNLRQSTV
jgi:hypothetical protein